MISFRQSGIDIKRAVVCEYHHAGFRAARFFHVLYTSVVDRNVFRIRTLAVESSDRSRFEQVVFRGFCAVEEQYGVGTGYVLCVEPHV